MNPAYKKSRFRSSCPAKDLPGLFWIITAGNPDGVTLPDAENAARTEAFRVQLVEHGLRYFPVEGYDPDSPHREAGFGVICDAATALAFGRQWEQEAIYRVEESELILVSGADPGEESALGSWLSKTDRM